MLPTYEIADLKELYPLVMELEELFSVTRSDSEVYAINQSAGEWTPIQAETLYLLHNALTLGERSEGALDISIYPVV